MSVLAEISKKRGSVPEFKIGNTTHKSKSAAIQSVKSFLHNKENWFKPFDQRSAEFTAIVALMMLHPEASEKIGVGIRHFIIYPNKITPGFGEFNFVRTDGSLDHFSYKCIFSRRTQLHYTHESMRTAVKKQLSEFRAANSGKPCHVCGGQSEEVDHFDPEFSELRDQFIGQNPGILALETGEISDDNRSYFLDKNHPVVKAWQEFHVSDFRMICRGCNWLSKEEKRVRISTRE
jgi:hypothetical protein